MFKLKFRKYKIIETFHVGLSKLTQFEVNKSNLDNMTDIMKMIQRTEDVILAQMNEESKNYNRINTNRRTKWCGLHRTNKQINMTPRDATHLRTETSSIINLKLQTTIIDILITTRRRIY